MFKNEIKFITDFNTAKLKNYSGFLSFNDIRKSKLHLAVLKYVLAEIEQQLFLDRQKLIKNSIFEYDDDRINNYLNLISENIKRTNKFKFEYLSKLVQEAVVFNTHFLIAPNKTLTQFVFENTNKKTTKEITLALSHIYYYKYFKKIILAYLEKKNIESISKNEFITLLKKIDLISKKSHLTDTINTAINSMADFFKTATSNKIPTQAIYLFLQGKKLTNHTKIIQSRFLDKSIAAASSTDIRNILGTVVLEEEILVEDKNEEKLNLVEETVSQTDNNIKESVDIDIDENDHIPNEELLSSESTIVDKTIENDRIFNKENLTENIQNIEEQEISFSQTEKEEGNENKIPDLTNQEKPDAKATIHSLMNIDSLYDSILPEDKNNDNEEIKITDTNTFLAEIDNKIDFKFEKSTLEESLVNENFFIEDDSELNQFQSIYESDLEPNELIKSKEDLFIEEEKDEINQITETEEKIKEVDKYISESKTEHINTAPIDINKNLQENYNESELKTDLELENIHDEISDESVEEDITLSENNDEEMTEVFSDLTYLDKEEVEEELIEEIDEEQTVNEDEFEELTLEDENITNDGDENEILTKTDIISDTKVSTQPRTFKEMVTNEDMSQIIEVIFDYDMEDYQRILNNISQSSAKNEALKVLDEYCNQNYISTSFTEVKNFRDLISNYFKQH